MRHRATRLLMTAIVTLAVLAGSTPAPAQGTTLPPIRDRIFTAMTTATAYRMVSDSTSAGATMAGKATTHREIIRLRHGQTTRMYMAVESKAASGLPRVSQFVYTGAHMCRRQSRTAAWNCHYPVSMFQGMALADPAAALGSLGGHMEMSPTGSIRTIQGQTWTVYKFTETLTSVAIMTIHGTWCINPATMLPVQMQSVSSEVLVKGQPPLVITGTQVYSHWSDSALTIPTVPAS